MRASSLSNARVIELLNSYYIPVYLRNQDYSEAGVVSTEEKVEKTRIYREAIEAKMSAGTVCIYLLTPDAHPVDTAPLNEPDATNPQRLAEKLTKVARELKIVKAQAIAPPKRQSRPKQSDPSGLLLHLTARYLERENGQLVRLDTESVLGSQKGGNWGDLPSEAWISIPGSETAKLLPVSDVRVGSTWEIDPAIAAMFLTHFFPPTENTDVRKNRILEQSLRGRIESIQDGVARASLAGRLTMKHPFYHRDDDQLVKTALIGYLEFETSPLRVRSFQLITENATYGSPAGNVQPFGVAVRSVPVDGF